MYLYMIICKNENILKNELNLFIHLLIDTYTYSYGVQISMSNLWRRLTYAMTAVSSMYVIHLHNKTSSNQMK